MKICVVIPVYNHGLSIGTVVDAVQKNSLPCLLVDDGSEQGCAKVLDDLSKREGVFLTRLPFNQGKGGAVMAGFRAANRLGYTHVLQIDADGQHQTNDIPLFLEQAKLHPDKVICGCPIYDESVPKSRLYGRYATHIWVWINTLSLDIRDSMCGFRVYPLELLMPLLEKNAIGKRMDFDVEILVRLYWRGVRLINVPTKVTYPIDGISHFRIIQDNLLISWMHTRLFFGMLLRLPFILYRKFCVA